MVVYTITENGKILNLYLGENFRYLAVCYEFVNNTQLETFLFVRYDMMRNWGFCPKLGGICKYRKVLY